MLVKNGKKDLIQDDCNRDQNLEKEREIELNSIETKGKRVFKPWGALEKEG